MAIDAQAEEARKDGAAALAQRFPRAQIQRRPDHEAQVRTHRSASGG